VLPEQFFAGLKAHLNKANLKTHKKDSLLKELQCYMKQASYVVSFTMVYNLHRVTIVTRGLAKKLSGYIYF